MSRRRTYWHLEAQTRRPTDYDIATTRLLYHSERGFAVDTPVANWVRRHQIERPLRSRDWDTFRDPRETTYRRYVEIERDREVFVDGVLERIESTDYDARLSPAWLTLLDRVLAPLRYPLHGLQMVTAYVGSMAPGSRVVVACLLQTADEIRRIQRLAYRLRLLQRTHPSLGVAAQATWESDALWQPCRELIEKLLVAYDWDEALAALTLAVKPAFDELFLIQFGAVARAMEDELLDQMFLSLHADCVWHREWSTALVEWLVGQDETHASLLGSVCERWQARTRSALAPFAELFDTTAARPLGTADSAIDHAMQLARHPIERATGERTQR